MSSRRARLFTGFLTGLLGLVLASAGLVTTPARALVPGSLTVYNTGGFFVQGFVSYTLPTGPASQTTGVFNINQGVTLTIPAQATGVNLLVQHYTGITGWQTSCVRGYPYATNAVVVVSGTPFFASCTDPDVSAAPAVAADLLTVSAVEGATVSATGTFADPDNDPVTLASSVGTVTGGGAADGTWTWSVQASDGPSSSGPVTVTATDSRGRSAQTRFDLEVTNAPPVVAVPSLPPGPRPADAPLPATAAFTDPGVADTHTASWSWGDGSPPSEGDVAQGSGSGTVAGSHTYTEGGVFRVTATVTDSDGATASRRASITVVDPDDATSGEGRVRTGEGACRLTRKCRLAAGPADFTFAVRHARGALVPSGRLTLAFPAGGFRATATRFTRLVVDPGTRQAVLAGRAAVNGVRGHTFTLWATPRTATEAARLRLRVVTATGALVYDNRATPRLRAGWVRSAS